MNRLARVFIGAALAVLPILPLFAAENAPAADAFMAQYEGFWTAANGTKGRMTAQIRPVGKGEYDGFILLNRAKMPVAAFQLKKATVADSGIKFSGSTAAEAGGDLLANNQLTAEANGKTLVGTFSGELGEGKFEAAKSSRPSPTLGEKAPKHAIVLFDGQNANGWKEFTWKVKDGAIEVGKGNIQAKEKLSSYRLHLEFRTPLMPEATGQGRGNSGVYLQGKYEVQVLDSFGLYPLRDNDCGGIYSVKAPSQNACFPPGEWQTYDITYIEGNGSRPPRVTIKLNGTTILERVEIPKDIAAKGTGGGTTEPGFLLLQDHGNPVQFRNIWAEPIFSSQKLR